MKRLLLLVLICLIPSQIFATLDVRTIWEVNSAATAGNVNGGGFDPYASTANMISDLACTVGTTSAPDCTSATYTFIAGDQNHWLFISSGTGFTSVQFCQIGTVSAGHAILNAAIGQCNIPNTSTTGVASALYWGTNSVAGVGSASPTAGVFSIDRSRSTASVQTTSTATDTVLVITLGGLTYNKTWIGNVIQAVGGAGVTQGWYEITDSTAGTSFTLDRTTSGTTNVSFNLGGAISLGSGTANRTDTTFFGLMSGTNGTGASRVFITGNPTLGISVAAGTAGGTLTPVVIAGYKTVRDDFPSGTNRPVISGSTTISPITPTVQSFAVAAQFVVRDLQFYTTSTTGFSIGASGRMSNLKVINSSPTAARVAITMADKAQLRDCEAVSYRGDAVLVATGGITVVNNWIHDSNRGIVSAATTNTSAIINNIVESTVTAALIMTAAATAKTWISNNTFYGGSSTNNITGLSFATGTTGAALMNNIINGFATGVTNVDVQSIQFDAYNDYFGNNADVNDITKWIKGNTDLALSPTFTNVGLVTGSTATTTSGNHLVQSGATFIASGVTAGRDYVYVISGTGVTAGIYGILSVDSATQITTDIAITANATGDKVFQITTGHNFTVGSNISSAGSPGPFQGGNTQGFLGIGAVQSSSGGSGSHIIGGQE